MLVLEIRIEGEGEDDLTLALEEVSKKVEEGYLSGFDSNDSGNYYFDINEE